MPEQGSLHGYFPFWTQSVDKADPIYMLYGPIIAYSCHFHNTGIKILYNNLLITDRIGRYFAWPFYQHRLPDPTFTCRSLTTAQGLIVGMFLPAPGHGAQSTIIGHK